MPVGSHDLNYKDIEAFLERDTPNEKVVPINWIEDFINNAESGVMKESNWTQFEVCTTPYFLSPLVSVFVVRSTVQHICNSRRMNQQTPTIFFFSMSVYLHHIITGGYTFIIFHCQGEQNSRIL